MKVRLQLFMSSDIPLLYQWMMDPEDQYLFSTTLNINSLEHFSKWLHFQMENSFHDFFMMGDIGNRYGYMHTYDFSMIDGTCYVCVYVRKDMRNSGIAGFYYIQFMDHLFRVYPLRKIYITVYGYNLQSLNSNLKAGFEQEGIMKGSKYHDGKYHDTYILSITRNRFYEKYSRMIFR